MKQFNSTLIAIALTLAAFTAKAQFEFAVKSSLQTQGVMSSLTQSSTIALAASDGSTYMLGGFDTEFEFAGRTLTPVGTDVCSYLLKYAPDGTEQWAMHITGDTKVQAATMSGDNLIVAVRFRGAGNMVGIDGSARPILDEGFKVVLLLISPDGAPLGMKELVAEDTDDTIWLLGFAIAPANLRIASIVAEGDRVALAGDLTGLLKIDGVAVAESNKFDPENWFDSRTTPHQIAFMGVYDMSTDAFVRLDTIRPRINESMQPMISTLSMTMVGGDVYWAVNVQDTVSCDNKIWEVPVTSARNCQNGLLLAKINDTGWEWDRFIVVDALGEKMAQPYVNPYAMEIVGDKLLMAGLFSAEADLGNNVKLKGLAPKLAADTSDYFFAIANAVDGQITEAHVFGNVDTAELSSLSLVYDGQSAIMMGAYKGTLSTAVGSFTSHNNGVDNFLLRYNITTQKWDGMSFGGPADDYATSLVLTDDTLLVAGMYADTIGFNSITGVKASGAGNNAYCVRFFDEWFNISIGITSNGQLIASPTEGAVVGRIISVSSMPSTGYRFVAGSLKVYKTGEPTVEVEVTNNTFVMPAYDVTIEGKFEEIPVYTFTATANIAAAGTVGVSADAIYEGTEVVFTATPNSGYKFVAWMEGETEVSKANPYKIIASKDLALVAVFEKVTGLRDNKYAPITLFPNPTKGAVQVQAQGDVRIFTANGLLLQRVKSQGSVLIDLSAYPSGVYIIKAGNAVAKVLKM